MSIINDDKKLAFFSDGIRYLRMNAGMKQNEMADVIGVEDSKISKYEHECAMPDVSIINKICDMFHLPSDYFYAKELFQKDDAAKPETPDAADIENSSEVFNEEIYTNEMPEDFGRNQ